MLSIAALYSAQRFLALVKRAPSLGTSPMGSFRLFSLAPANDVLAICQECQWVRLNTSGKLEITDRGEDVLRQSHSELALRVQLGHLIETQRPAWLPLLGRGREEARKYLPPDFEQCMRESGLFSGASDDVVKWWDQYSKMSRRLDTDDRVEVGRVGEKLSLEHERQRTKREPIWRGFESNLAGFDILSVVAEDDPAPLRIEVKTSNSRPADAMFYVSRNEWAVAKASGSYLFHLWSLRPSSRLLTITFAQVRQHIPLNRGTGGWQNVSVPYSAFTS
jgi:hypothetical protein